MATNISNYPDDIIIQILSKLSLPQLRQVCQTDRRINRLCDKQLLWRLKIEDEFPDLLMMISPTDILKNIYINTYNERYLTGRAEMIEISDDQLKIILGSDYKDYQTFEDYTNFDEIIQLLNIHITQLINLLDNLLNKDVKRGDIMYLEKFGRYRNIGKFIYDGLKLQNLYHRLDDYGSIPPTFQVIHEFPIRYWTNVIEHNSIVFFNPHNYIDQISQNLHPLSDLYAFQTHFIYSNDITYTIIIYSESNFDHDLEFEDIITLLSVGIFEAINPREDVNIPSFFHNSYNPDTTLIYRLDMWFPIEDFLQ